MIMEIEPIPLGKDSLPASLIDRVAARVRESTHNRIRNLSVEEVQGRFVVGGEVASQHMKQLALHGALELLSGDQFASEIVVSNLLPPRAISG